MGRGDAGRMVAVVERERPALEASTDRSGARRTHGAECPRTAVRRGPVLPVRELRRCLLTLLGVAGIPVHRERLVGSRATSDSADERKPVLGGPLGSEPRLLKCLHAGLHRSRDTAHDDAVSQIPEIRYDGYPGLRRAVARSPSC